jgi:hypothetical protein
MFENPVMVDALANSGGDDVQTFFAQEIAKVPRRERRWHVETGA